MNEPIVAVMVGLLLALSAGVRTTVPLLAISLLAVNHIVALPGNVAWLGTQPTLIILSVAFAAETTIHFVPAVGTWLKATATPLAFAAGTLLMAVPLGDHNPLYQWTLSAALGGGMATLAHLGVTGLRVAAAPANVASLGIFGILWNIGEPLVSILLTALGGLCVIAGWIVGMLILCLLGLLAVIVAIKGLSKMGRTEVRQAGS